MHTILKLTCNIHQDRSHFEPKNLSNFRKVIMQSILSDHNEMKSYRILSIMERYLENSKICKG